MSLDMIEGGKEVGDVGFVCVLGGSESGFVDAIIDMIVDPSVNFVDSWLEFFR